MFGGFDELFGKKLRNVAYFVKKHEESSIWPKVSTFRGFDELFGKKLQKVAHLVKEHEKSSILRKLATFRGNHYVSRF